MKLHIKVVEHHTSLGSILYATLVILKLLHLSVALFTALLFVAFVLKSSQNGIFQQLLNAVCQGGKVYKKFLQSDDLFKLLFHTLLDEIYPHFMFITGVFLLPLLLIFSGHWTATI